MLKCGHVDFEKYFEDFAKCLGNLFCIMSLQCFPGLDFDTVIFLD